MRNLIFRLSPSLIWNIPSKEKVLYLTFDDGPIPEVTPWILNLLEKYKAKATFFCVGNNVLKNREIFDKILENGHRVGNHTMHHVNGWKTKNENYFKDIQECEKMFSSDLFRPPYGKIKLTQIFKLKKKFRIIFWDSLSKDYDLKLSGEECFSNVLNNAKRGSIIVFHDSLKAEPRLRYALPKVLEHFSAEGFEFRAL